MTKTYRVVEIFPTLQGEGYHAGTPFVFVRFQACNLWSGKEQDRERDATRHKAKCPLFCDTDFRYGDVMSLGQLLGRIDEAAYELADEKRVVFTGGEPLLQLDAVLAEALAQRGYYIAIETNGTVALDKELASILDWVCVSPKVVCQDLKIIGGDELKVVFPDYEPFAYTTIAHKFTYRWIQPAAVPTKDVGKSVLAYDVMERAAKACMSMHGWRLSLQTHKIAGVR